MILNDTAYNLAERYLTVLQNITSSSLVKRSLFSKTLPLAVWQRGLKTFLKNITSFSLAERSSTVLFDVTSSRLAERSEAVSQEHYLFQFGGEV